MQGLIDAERLEEVGRESVGVAIALLAQIAAPVASTPRRVGASSAAIIPVSIAVAAANDLAEAIALRVKVLLDDQLAALELIPGSPTQTTPLKEENLGEWSK